jgi:hypothetical protein
VVQAIPTYSVSVFLLPKTLCKALNTLMNKFWWGHKANHNRISWMSWERLGVSKCQGGIGFRDLQVFNKALLAKQGWRLLSYPKSLVARIFKEKYYHTGSFMKATIVSIASYVLVCNWLHYVGQNHFFVMMHLNRDSAIQSSSRRFCTVYKPEKSDPLQPFGRRDIPSGRPTIQSIIHSDDENFPSGPSSVSRSFELFQLA